MQIQATKVEQKHGSILQPHRLRDEKVSDLIADNRRLVEVPYTASLADTMNALIANRITAVAVAAPPGHWIGAGGSMILEADKHTGEVRKHYIGMVTMLDILAQIAGNHVDTESGGGDDDLDQKMNVPVSSIIGRCLESLSLWTLNCNTRFGILIPFSTCLNQALQIESLPTFYISNVFVIIIRSLFFLGYPKEFYVQIKTKRYTERSLFFLGYPIEFLA